MPGKRSPWGCGRRTSPRSDRRVASAGGDARRHAAPADRPLEAWWAQLAFLEAADVRLHRPLPALGALHRDGDERPRGYLRALDFVHLVELVLGRVEDLARALLVQFAKALALLVGRAAFAISSECSRSRTSAPGRVARRIALSYERRRNV